MTRIDHIRDALLIIGYRLDDQRRYYIPNNYRPRLDLHQLDQLHPNMSPRKIAEKVRLSPFAPGRALQEPNFYPQDQGSGEQETYPSQF